MKHKKIYFSGLIMIIAAAAVISLTQVSQVEASVSQGTSASSTSARLNSNGRFGAKMLNKLKGNKDAQATRETRDANRATHQAAVTAALDANNYEAWVTAVGSNNPELAKINSNNFSQYVQAYQLRKQADAIMTGLGIDKGMGHGFMNHADNQSN